MELDNMRVLATGKKAKAKKKKKGKKSKKKKKKNALKGLPGAKSLKDPDEYQYLVELIQNNICKKLPPSSLSEFIGEFNYIHSMIDNLKKPPFDPSMALIR